MRRRASLWTQFPGDRAGQMHRWRSTEDRGQTSVLRRVLSSPLKTPAMQEQDVKREQGEPRKELVWGGHQDTDPNTLLGENEPDSTSGQQGREVELPEMWPTDCPHPSARGSCLAGQGCLRWYQTAPHKAVVAGRHFCSITDAFFLELSNGHVDTCM